MILAVYFEMILLVDLKSIENTHGECECDWEETIVFLVQLKFTCSVTLMFSSAILCADIVEIIFNAILWTDWEQKQFKYCYFCYYCCCCCFAVTPDVQITIYDSHSMMWFVYFWMCLTLDFRPLWIWIGFLFEINTNGAIIDWSITKRIINIESHLNVEHTENNV